MESLDVERIRVTDSLKEEKQKCIKLNEKIVELLENLDNARRVHSECEGTQIELRN